MSKDLFLTYFVITLPVALVTTRMFYCITDGIELKYWFSFTDEVHGIRAGGLSIIGGIIGGTVSVFLISYFKKSTFSARRTVSSWGCCWRRRSAVGEILPIRKFTGRK